MRSSTIPNRSSLQTQTQWGDLVLAQAPVILFSTDPELRVTLSRGAGLAVLGLQPDEVVGMPLEDYFRSAPPDFPMMGASRRALAGAEVDFEAEWMQRYYRSHVRPLRAQDGSIVGIIGVSIDITDLRDAELKLIDRETRLDLLLNQLPVFVWSTDTEMTISFSRGRVLELIRRQPDDLVGVSLLDLFHRQGIDDPEYSTIAATRRALRGESRTFDEGWQGRDFQVTVRPLRDESGRIRGTLGVAADITERLRAEKRHRESEDRFRRLFQGIRDAVFVFASGEDEAPERCVEVNDAACRMLGYTRDELLRLPARDLQAALGGEPGAGADRPDSDAFIHRILAAKDGHRVIAEISVQRLEFDGKPSILAVVRDVTERRNLEQQLRHLQKMDVLGRMAGSIAHDFNNQLTVISSFSTVALQGNLPLEQAREYIGEVKKASDRAADLTKQLLAFSRRQVLEPQLLRLNEVIRDSEASLRQVLGKQRHLVLELAPDLAMIRADSGQLHQVLMNLAINARDAMQPEGNLTILTRNLRLDQEPVQTPPGSASGDYVMLEFRDTGYGVSEDVKERMFEPFFTTKDPGEGTGLGLSTCYGIVTQSNGHIAVDGRPGAGTTIRIYLPPVAPDGG